MREPYQGNWRKKENRKIMKGTDLEDLRIRVEGIISRGWRIISKPEYQEEMDVMGKVTHFCLLERTEAN